ncbi:MAG: EMC3/TMCO1 family protein [archaeon]
MVDVITNATTNATLIAMNNAPGFLGHLNPFWGIFLISVILSLATTLVYRYVTDQQLIKQCKDDTKKYQEQLKQCKSDPAKQMEIQKQMMPLQSNMMMQQMKPTLITLLPFLAIFWLLGRWYNTLAVVPLPFHVPLSHLTTGLGWVGTYIIFSMVFTTLFRKVLKVV